MTTAESLLPPVACAPEAFGLIAIVSTMSTVACLLSDIGIRRWALGSDFVSAAEWPMR